jgi:hypothetical protein
VSIQWGRFGTLYCEGPDCIAIFEGDGLTKESDIRAVAADLEGWGRKKVIVALEPMRTRCVDLCEACQQLEYRIVSGGWYKPDGKDSLGILAEEEG